MKLMHKWIIAAAMMLGAGGALGQTLRIGLQDDLGTLDPHRSGQVVERIVFASLCDTLVDITPDLNFAPKLATSWSGSADGKTLTLKLRQGVKFHDGEPFNAAAVKANLDRARGWPLSLRRAELASIDHVDAVDPDTVAIVLKNPDAALLSTLSDRAGMMLAPNTLGDDAGVASHPVCSGPYRFVERVQNDRVVLEKFAGYWNAAQYPIQKVVYRPMPDGTVRLANLRSGALDMIERVSPSDITAVRNDANLRFVSAQGLGYFGLTYNVGNGGAARGPWQDKRVREALNLLVDRAAIGQVIGAGIFTSAAQALPPTSPYFDKAIGVPKRDVAQATALLKAAGFANGLEVELTFGNNTVANQMAQMVQAMAAEANIRIKLRPTDYAAALDAARKGSFQLLYVGWSGRVDPDGNLHDFVTCKGALNYGRYCNPKVDALLDDARMKTDMAARKALYDSALQILADEQPITYVYYQPWPFALSKKVSGFTAYPDGLIRLRGMNVGG
jgi:peptide/nickel transport system substrate-binding protein